MRATINGITVEGTPQEIAEYRKLTEVTMDRDIKQNSDWMKYLPTPTTGQTIPNKCPNHGQSCFCTGECQGSTNVLGQDILGKLYKYTMNDLKNDQIYGPYTSK